MEEDLAGVGGGGGRVLDLAPDPGATSGYRRAGGAPKWAEVERPARPGGQEAVEEAIKAEVSG